MAVTNTFPTGFPEPRLGISSVHNKPIEHVTIVEEQCASFVELEVVCKNYEDLRSECSRTSTLSKLSTSVHATTQLPITPCALIKSKSMYCECNKLYVLRNSPPSCTAGIGHWCTGGSVTSCISWLDIVSCVILLRRGQTVHKQQ